ncbi:small ribosomal subunit protein uS15m-like [Clytia hemisphaerica]|uniref:Small ribosomal subunit protein uS15m n=1 Tax=Clytia hemisphaerica TaxID=252671 RepID=A0A7M5VE81_9CNID|eukprot:TCONS_00029540-protein
MNTFGNLLRVLPRVPLLPTQRLLIVPSSNRICGALNSTWVPDNLPKYRDGFNEIPELETADPVVQKLFSLEMADGIETRKVLRTINTDKYETKLEKNIANNTLHIRMLVEQLKQNHKDKQNKVFLIWAIDQRKKRLRRLQKLDINKYNSLIEEYDIPPLESPQDPQNKYKFRKFKINVPLEKKRNIEDFEKDRNY